MLLYLIGCLFHFFVMSFHKSPFCTIFVITFYIIFTILDYFRNIYNEQYQLSILENSELHITTSYKNKHIISEFRKEPYKLMNYFTELFGLGLWAISDQAIRIVCSILVLIYLSSSECITKYCIQQIHTIISML